jgi:hypothetical protein
VALVIYWPYDLGYNDELDDGGSSGAGTRRKKGTTRGDKMIDDLFFTSISFLFLLTEN